MTQKLTRASGTVTKSVPGVPTMVESYDYSSSNPPVLTYTKSTEATPSTTYSKVIRTSYADSTVYRRAILDKAPLPFFEQYYEKELFTPWRGSKTIRSTKRMGDAGSGMSVRTGEFDIYNGYSNTIITSGSAGGLSTFEISTVGRLASNKLLLAIKNQKVNLAQAFAERKQTVDLVASTATKIALALKATRKGNLVDAAKALGCDAPKRASRRAAREARVRPNPTNKQMSRRWLELQYGWRPLVSDVYGSMESIADTGKTPTPYYSVVARHIVKRPFTNVVRDVSTELQVEKGTLYYKHQYTVRYSIDNPFTRSLSQLGITNPLLIAWELMPWSFVIDWFLPVGNAISSLDATVGCTFHSGIQSKTWKVMGEATLTYRTRNSSQVIEGNVTRGMQRFQTSRSLLSSFPTPSLPSFKNPLGFDHVANAIALLLLQRKK